MENSFIPPFLEYHTIFIAGNWFDRARGDDNGDN